MPKEITSGDTVGARITRRTQETLTLLNARRVVINAKLRKKGKPELPTMSQPVEMERAVEEYADRLNVELDRLESEGQDAR